MNHSTRKSKP